MVTLDDNLVRIAQEFTGLAEKTALLREALKALVERESAQRLASLGGTMPGLKNIPRRSRRPDLQFTGCSLKISMPRTRN
jgi:Arc/MetJ family transcription regulator